MEDGKYIMTLSNINQEVIVSTLLEGQYPWKGTRQFVCIPFHFPIPLDSWVLKDAAFRPAAQPGVQADVCICGHTRRNHDFFEDHDECELCECESGYTRR